MSDPNTSGATPQMPNFQVRIPLEWTDADDIPILYANQVMISHAGPEFFIQFGVVLPPSTADELPDSLVIKPQVRIVVAREAMPAIVQAMNDNLSRYRANIARQQPPAPEAPPATPPSEPVAPPDGSAGSP
jgi:hypothetical protein